ncbi:MAG: FkbM family methyltransferase [Rhodobacteraceae bacterium]|nr:FkbM family methyltransferase [Paracoccaceae bacterium]
MSDEGQITAAPAGAPFVTPLVRVVRAEVHGRTVFFAVEDPRDAIQRHHMQGAFYEAEELAIIARHFPIGGRYCDIGANVGNHAVYVATFLHAARVVLFEPNPPAIALLRANIMLNGLETVCDMSHLGLGLSDAPAASVAMAIPAKNLGGSRVVAGDGGIRLERGDTVLGNERFDLLKIDVEGMEMKVLSGLSGLIAATRPAIFIEVDRSNQAAFADWLREVDYTVEEEFSRYRANTNYLVKPRDGAATHA